MGNAQYNLSKAPVDVVRFLERDLTDLSFREVLGNGRFLKTIHMAHDHGSVVVKMFIKRDAAISLESHLSALVERRERLNIKRCPNVIPFVKFFETERGGYLIRQYFYMNLYDRISTRPFLIGIERKWIAFQLLHALQQIHDQNICHGDIKTTNVQVTTWLWIYISDFAQFKPTYVPEDNPTDFSFFFDTNSKRTCYLAPERFDNTLAPQRNLPLTPAMDIFSMGCVIAELFMDGQPVFELSQLLSYRKSEYDVKSVLTRIQDDGIRELVTSMLSLDPKNRKTARDYIYENMDSCFPSHFPSVHEYIAGMMHISPDGRIRSIEKDQINILNNLGYLAGDPTNETFWYTDTMRRNQKTGEDGPVRKRVTPLESQKPSGEYVMSAVKSFLDVLEQRSPLTDAKVLNGSDPLLHGVVKSSKPVTTIGNPLQKEGNVPDVSIRIDDQLSKKGQSIILFLNVVCSSIRNVRFPSSKRAALTIIWNFARYLDSDQWLQRLVPYVASLLSDTNALVKVKAINVLVDLLAMVQSFPLSDANVFPEYIMSCLSFIPNDPEEIVRAAFAQNIARLAEIGRNFLEIAQSIKKKATMATEKQSNTQLQESYDASLKSLKDSFSHVVSEMLTDKSSIVRRSVLEDITRLCIFFGRKRTNESLLPCLITSLNEKDWELRCAIFQNIIGLSTFVGRSSLESYILPCILQALGDDEEFALEKSLSCLASLSELGLFRTTTLVEILEKVTPLLVHPNLWIRHGAVGFVASVSSKLPPLDVFCYLLPCVQPFLVHEVAEITELSLLNALKIPFSRSAFVNVINMSIESKGSAIGKPQEPIDKTQEFLMMSKQEESSLQERRLKAIYPMNIYNQQLTIHPDYMAEANEATIHSMQTYVESTSHGIRTRNRQREISPGSGPENELRQDLDKIRNLSQYVKFHTQHVTPPVYEHPSETTSNKSAGSQSQPLSLSKKAMTPLSAMHAMGSTSTLASAPSIPTTPHAPHQPMTPNFPTQFATMINTSPSLKPLLETNTLESFPMLNKPLADFLSLNQESYQSLQAKLHQTPLPPLPDMKVIRGAPVIPVQANYGRGASWKPRGILVGHLAEHRGAINQIRVSEDNAFFATCSDDGTVRIWDCQRIDKHITNRSVLAYDSQGGRINSIVICEGTHSIACASENGSVHVFRVEYSTKEGGVPHRYTGPTSIREIPSTSCNYQYEGPVVAIEHFNEDPQSMLVFSTARSNVHGWDLRTHSSSWILKNGVPFGIVHKMLLDPQRKWLITATNRGYVTHWDLRFQIPLVTWKFPLGAIQQMVFFNRNRDQPQVLISAGNTSNRTDSMQMMTVWDMISMSCIQSYRMVAGNTIQPMPSLVAQRMLDNKPPLTEEFFREPSLSEQYQTNQDPLNAFDGRTQAICVSPDHSYFFSGGSDKKIRFWDLADISKSFVMSGLDQNYRVSYSTQQYDQMVIHMEQTSRLNPVNKNAYDMEARVGISESSFPPISSCPFSFFLFFR
eukprot:TRINITY_DN4200_c0_g1_i1.p1 TRINITY_DN4200_c0_g1~~TRINITY_DN4200_c0_g1_i1.p1  ORF type:complete len:1490 (+),score=267.46 TRINITY_DN4200_c0_g1_i1:48-4517(+)